jgi:hypothetical protein
VTEIEEMKGKIDQLEKRMVEMEAQARAPQERKVFCPRCGREMLTHAYLMKDMNWCIPCGFAYKKGFFQLRREGRLRQLA